MKWGTKYGPEYVNRLYGMIARNITPPFSVTVLTDDPRGLRPELRSATIPDVGVDMPKGVPGKWPKSALWGKELAGLSGPVLFMDLDVVVTGSLDDFFSHGDPDEVILSRNAAKPFHRLGQTSLFRFPVGKLAPMQQKFRDDPQGMGERYRYEQNYVTQNAPGGVTFWPRQWVRHFRIQCVPTFPLNFFLAPPRPRNARVVIFAGHLNPPDAIAGRWNRKEEARTIGQHIRHALTARKGYKGLRSYVKPTPWVAEAWRE
ncbi:glycosyl transferase [Jannaschia sp. S6380]|uniref:glycosyl transferase n=1 Tax=Jannaschia sp. S6380 TaxID=2926408 RepID=UPI001FF6F28F|nr:glycosyl transferase [Jannaschia sp. S6380]MCK0168855.1 glycosyl transferase [Jannaschia sp. S6380]